MSGTASIHFWRRSRVSSAFSPRGSVSSDRTDATNCARSSEVEGPRSCAGVENAQARTSEVVTNVWRRFVSRVPPSRSLIPLPLPPRALRLPVRRAVRGEQPGLREQLDEEKAGGEAADVRPEGDTAPTAAAEIHHAAHR